jgi:prophage regulatory protein
MPKFLRLAQVREKTGLSRSAIYAMADFPKPVPIGLRAVAWVEAELDAWMEARIVERA